MTYTEFLQRSLALVAIITVTILVILLIGQVVSVLLIAFVCWLIAVGLDVPITALQQRGFRRGIAIVITLAGVGLVGFLLVFLVVPPMFTQIANVITGLPEAVESIIEEYTRFWEATPLAQNFLPPYTVAEYREFLEGIAEITRNGSGTFIDLDLGSLVQSAAIPVIRGIGGVIGVLFNLILALMIIIYMLIDPLIYYRAAIAVVPRQYEDRAVSVINGLRRVAIAWFGSLAVAIGVTFVLVALVLSIIRVPDPIALAAIAGLGNLVPYIGYWIGLTPIAIFAAASTGFGGMVVAVAAYVIVGNLEANVITPNIIKRNLSIPPVLTLIGQLICAALLGLVGLLLAVPILGVFKVIIGELYVDGALGKKESLSEVVQLPDGRLALVPPIPEDAPVVSAAPATDATAPPAEKDQSPA